MRDYITIEAEAEYLSDSNKLKRIREYCNENQVRCDEMVNFDWVLGHIMCIVKYGDGFEMKDVLDVNEIRFQKAQQSRLKLYIRYFRDLVRCL